MPLCALLTASLLGGCSDSRGGPDDLAGELLNHIDVEDYPAGSVVCRAKAIDTTCAISAAKRAAHVVAWVPGRLSPEWTAVMVVLADDRRAFAFQKLRDENTVLQLSSPVSSIAGAGPTPSRPVRNGAVLGKLRSDDADGVLPSIVIEWRYRSMNFELSLIGRTVTESQAEALWRHIRYADT